MTSLSTDTLAELIRKKHQILVQLRTLGLRQAEQVDDQATQNVLQLLTAKQHLINALQMVEHRLRPFQSQDPESRQWPSPEARAACATQAEQCQHLLAEVLQLEQQQETQMRHRRDEVAAKLKQAGAAKAATGAYNQYRAPPSSSRPLFPVTQDPVTQDTEGVDPPGGLDLTSDVG